MKWAACFVGREIGAIGVFQAFQIEVEGDTERDAELDIYKTHEHISQLVLTPINSAIIKRDGREIDRVAPTEGAITAWFMRNTNQSMAYAVKFDGYTVENEAGESLLPADFTKDYNPR